MHLRVLRNKCRQKLKENLKLHAAHLQGERSRNFKRREVMRMNMETNVDLKILPRIRSKERMQTTRKRRKEEQFKRTSTRYRSSRTLGKAVVKIKRNLPASHNKAVEVVKEISFEFNVAIFDQNDASEAAPRKLTDEGKTFQP
ncbi:hypothetical protein HHI36_017229 [Cryptolaemus montrouzieri]|uniref:Uncharacterized protein n=1 Tax=Cryptolaemus montrouzieri TaxID=559131 RepID=A0ABD2NMC2_9CUCU